VTGTLQGPHGSYKAQCQVVCRVPCLIQGSMTGIWQGPMVCTRLSDRSFVGLHGSYKAR